MLRHRVLHLDFDARANLLEVEIRDDWEPGVRENMRQNVVAIQAQLVAQYGSFAGARKLADFRAIGAAPFSVLAFHNAFYRQARDAFVAGAYYPALVGSCALGERILNHLLLLFRDDFSHTPEYRKVYRKDSFDNWDLAIDTLLAWQLILPATAEAFRELRTIRNRSLHFNPATDANARGEALAALRALYEVIDRQFTGFGDRPWYIPNDMGLTFVRKSFAHDPFVARVIVPSCALVGPAHDVEVSADGNLFAVDPTEYPAIEISDDEYLERFRAHRDEAGQQATGPRPDATHD
jgi:hypothetical protein